MLKPLPDVCREVCRVSDQSSCWLGPILSSILYPKSWQLLFSPKMTRILIYFLFCFPSRTPSPIPSYPKLLNISLFLPKIQPLPPPPTIVLNTVHSRNLVLIQSLFDSCLALGIFSALVSLAVLRGHCSIQNRWCTLKYLHSEKWHLLIWWFSIRRPRDFYNSEEDRSLICNCEFWFLILHKKRIVVNV